MDLAPGYVELPAPAWARHALACLWLRVVPPHGARPTRVLPDGCVDLIWAPGRGAFVAGADTGPVLVPAVGGSVLAGARFLPGAGGPALGAPLAALRDRRVDASDLDPGLERSLPPTLQPADALAAVAATAGRLVAARPPDLAVREAARRLADPRTRVGPLAAALGLSERQLRRRCEAAVGYGPKTLGRVLRFQVALARLDAPDPDLARVAADAGYADQAHLTRECVRLAGLSPAALVRARAADGRRVPAEGGADAGSRAPGRPAASRGGD